MRLTVNLDDDLYGVARSLSRAEDISISAALNRLLRRGLQPPARPRKDKSGLPTVASKRTFGPDDVADVDVAG